MLFQGANMLWEQARRYGQQSAINKVHNEIQSLEERRAKLCEGILSQQWRSISELQIILQTLEPTIIDQQAARWRLDVLKSTKEPDKLPSCSKTKTKSLDLSNLLKIQRRVTRH
jgi:DNA-directed RNA polymerase subunit F